MANVNVNTVDLNHGTSGSLAFEYPYTTENGNECINKYKFINGAFSPLNDAHYFGSVVFKMYKDWIGQAPLSFPLTMRVHYSNNYENAFWNGSSMTFGDGDLTFFPFVSLDISGHEVSHGSTEQNSNLIYSGQSGGINEAFSDIRNGNCGRIFFIVAALIVAMQWWHAENAHRPAVKSIPDPGPPDVARLPG